MNNRKTVLSLLITNYLLLIHLNLIHSVMGSTQDFDSWSSGSSPDELTAFTLIL